MPSHQLLSAPSSKQHCWAALAGSIFHRSAPHCGIHHFGFQIAPDLRLVRTWNSFCVVCIFIGFSPGNLWMIYNLDQARKAVGKVHPVAKGKSNFYICQQLNWQRGFHPSGCSIPPAWVSHLPAKFTAVIVHPGRDVDLTAGAFSLHFLPIFKLPTPGQ